MVSHFFLMVALACAPIVAGFMVFGIMRIWDDNRIPLTEKLPIAIGRIITLAVCVAVFMGAGASFVFAAL